MKIRPRELEAVALAYLLVALAMPAQVVFAHGYPLSEWAAALSKLAPLNWAVEALCLATAAAAWCASGWTWALVPAAIATVVINNAAVAAAATEFSLVPGWMSWIGALLFPVLSVPLLTRRAREALLSSRRRWWQTPIRSKLSLPIRLKVMPTLDRVRFRGPRECREILTRTFDVSERGAFIPLLPDPARGGERLLVGTQCYISLALEGMDYLQCRAEVVRLAASAIGRYPGGVGVRFLGLSWAEQRKWNIFLRGLVSGAHLVPSSGLSK